jgi:hypothetical protein
MVWVIIVGTTHEYSLLNPRLIAAHDDGHRLIIREYNHVTNFSYPVHLLTYNACTTRATMSRLASLSTPTRRQSPSPSPSPAPSESGVETTHHRMLKLLINEFKGVFRTWDELVGQDGVRAGQGVVNEGTTME